MVKVTVAVVALLALLAASSCASSSPVPAPGHGLAACTQRSGIEREKWKFAWFFREVECRARETLQCPTGSKQGAPASGSRWYSLLNVVVESNGAVRSVALAATSGRDDVDRAAIDAVRRAGPFSAPPPQLIQTGGGVPFRFGVECAAQPGVTAVGESPALRSDER